MKTVGDFKRAGLFFVKGDGYRHRGSTCEMMADRITLEWFERGIDNSLYAVITSFAWRENTGVKPGFSGLIEFTFNGEGCEMQEVRDANNINWAIVKKWRPHLPKVEDKPTSPYDVDAHVSGEKLKPVFTQAMCDAGELVSAGMMFTTEVGRDYCAEMVNSKSVCFTDEDGFLVGMPIGRAKPIQTEREKAIDSVKTVINEWVSKDGDSISALAEMIYERYNSALHRK